MQDAHQPARSGALMFAGAVMAAGGLAAYLYMTRDQTVAPSHDATAHRDGEVKQASSAPPAAPPAVVGLDEGTEFLLEASAKIKDAGNALLGEGKNEEAAEKYTSALETAEAAILQAYGKGEGSSQPTKELEALRLACLLNRAMAKLRLGKWQDVVSDTTRAMALGGETPKALYRRATALIGLNDEPAALTDLRAANKAVKGEDRLIGERLCKVLAQLADKAILNANVKDAQDMYEEGAAVARAHKVLAVEFHSRMALGSIYRRGGLPTQAAAMFARAAETSGAIGGSAEAAKREGMGQGDALIGRCHAMDACAGSLLSAGQMEAAERMVGSTMEYAKALGDDVAWCRDNCHGRLAVCCEIKGSKAVSQGDWRGAETHYSKMLAEADLLPEGWELGDGEESLGTAGLTKASIRTDALTMLAYATEVFSNNDKAKLLFAEALGLAVGMQDERRESDVRNGLGTLLSKAGDAEAAEAHLTRALELGKKLGHASVVAAATGNLGKVWMGMGKHDDAIKLFREAYEMRKNGNDVRGACAQAINLGGSLYIVNKDRAEAEKYFQEALDMADEKEMVEMQVTALRSLINHLYEKEAPASDHARAKALRVRLEGMMESRGRGQGGQCPITMEAFEDSSARVVVLECFHIVDAGAWDTWVAKKHEDGEDVQCPVCRHPIKFYEQEQ